MNTMEMRWKAVPWAADCYLLNVVLINDVPHVLQCRHRPPIGDFRTETEWTEWEDVPIEVEG